MSPRSFLRRGSPSIPCIARRSKKRKWRAGSLPALRSFVGGLGNREVRGLLVLLGAGVVGQHDFQGVLALRPAGRRRREGEIPVFAFGQIERFLEARNWTLRLSFHFVDEKAACDFDLA